jgi:hypothetical protein
MNVESHQALDVYDVQHVEVEVQDRYKPSGQKVLYVHVDGITLLRIVMTSMTTFKIDDKTDPLKHYNVTPPPAPLLTCHKCRHQQPRTTNNVEKCNKCGSTEVWM